MTARCSKCGEELLGAVNRCWKCGQTFVLRPEMDGRPPVRSDLPPIAEPPLEAVVVDEGATAGDAAAPIAAVAAPSPPPSIVPYALPRVARPAKVSTAELIDARRTSLMAMGGTVASILLGVFALMLSLFWFGGALIAALGLVMGIWGLYSSKRNWALVGMLLCCLAIGLGSYTGARQLYLYVQQGKPVVIEDDPVAP